MVHLAQLVGRADADGPHEVRDIEPIGAPGPGALLFGQPDLFFGNGGERGDCRKRRRGRLDDGQLVVGHDPCPLSSS